MATCGNHRRGDTAAGVGLALVLLAGAAGRAAPPVLECPAAPPADLGLWDDLFVPPDRDVVVLRRGDELFALDPAGPAKPVSLGKVPATAGTRATGGAAAGKRFWLFLDSRTAAPCAVDVFSGTVVPFDIPGLAVPGRQAPTVQAHVVVPHAAAALLMVSGGDAATWPRDGNRPIYFWLNLAAGKVVRFPTGWDLDHFSADERTAVFAVPGNDGTGHRPRQAVAVATGERTAVAPDLHAGPHVPFDWFYHGPVRTLRGWREGPDGFAGLSVAGQAVPIRLDLPGRRYLAAAKVGDGYAGFQLRPEGYWGKSQPLWGAPLDAPAAAEAVAPVATDFALLAAGAVVIVTPGHGRRGESEAAVYHPRGGKGRWDVLDEVDRLPPLDPAFAGRASVTDRLTVTLVEGFGTDRHPPLVACMCEHRRGDQRAVFPPPGERRLESVTWRRTLFVTGDGRRGMTPLLRDGPRPDGVWLHRSGTLLTGVDEWDGPDDGRRRRVRLTAHAVKLPGR